MDVPTADLIKGNAHKAVSILTRPRRETDIFETGELCRVADVRSTTHHQHTPSLVVEVVRTVDLKGRHGVGRGQIQFATPACSKHDGVLVHGVVDRVDEGTAAHRDGDPTYSMSLKAQYALVSTEGFKVNAFKVVRDIVHFVLWRHRVSSMRSHCGRAAMRRFKITAKIPRHHVTSPLSEQASCERRSG
jgi:hypothetical protein